MQQTVSTRFGGWLVVLLTALGLMMAPVPAHAHDVLVESTPEVGATVETTPTEVRLRFSGTPLSGEGLANLIRVTDAQGNQWQDEELAVEGYELAVPLCEGLPQGEYTVDYRVIYSDGHTGEESFTFTNADPNAPTEGAPEDCGEAVEQVAPAATPESTSQAQDTTDVENTATEAEGSASVPTWVWIVGGLGVLVVAGIVFLLLGRRADQAVEDPSDD